MSALYLMAFKQLFFSNYWYIIAVRLYRYNFHIFIATIFSLWNIYWIEQQRKTFMNIFNTTFSNFYSLNGTVIRSVILLCIYWSQIAFEYSIFYIGQYIDSNSIKCYHLNQSSLSFENYLSFPTLRLSVVFFDSSITIFKLLK